MASHNMTLSAVLMAALLLSPAAATNIFLSRNQDLVVAIEEMQRANYFTFVMLINMASPNLTQGNVTFLMPNDRTLAKTMMPGNAVVDFLLRHSIPSPLLFDHLVHIPTGSIIPTLKPEFMLRISNNGRKNYHLNNVKIISPNICTAGSSIRCHGIDGVVQATPRSPLPACSNSSSPMAAATPPAPSWPSSPSPSPSPSPAAPPVGSPLNAPRPPSSWQKSGSSQPPAAFRGLSLGLIMACLMLLRVKFCSIWSITV